MVCCHARRMQDPGTVFHNSETSSRFSPLVIKECTCRAYEALPTPLSTKCFYSTHSIPDASLARFASRHPKPYMARFTIRVTLVNCKADIVVLKFAIAIDVQFSGTCCSSGRCKERISTLGTEKMLFMVHPFTECRIIEGDEPLVDDGGLTMEAPWRKFLFALLLSQSGDP